LFFQLEIPLREANTVSIILYDVLCKLGTLCKPEAKDRIGGEGAALLPD
jgi:hypothetical protein